MRKLLSLALLAMSSLHVFSQELPEVTPPTPESASLAKFSEVPVSHYTGVPNINVPFYSINLDGLNIPIGLSYHARGVQVAETSSSVGLGWALQAGGKISRQTRHLPDEGGLNAIGMLAPGAGNMLASSLGSGAFFSNEDVRRNYGATLTANIQHDRLPDKFILQVTGLSANFIFDYKTKTPLLQKYDNVQIEKIMGDNAVPIASNIIKGFIVTDKSGFKYYLGVSKDKLREAQDFDQTNFTYSINSNGYTRHAPPFDLTFNTWHLMDVESPKGELVSFYYKSETAKYVRRSYDNPPTLQTGSTAFASEVLSHQKQLDSISFKQGSIKFINELPREDLRNAKSLGKVIVKDVNGDVVKWYELNQNFENTIDNGPDYTNTYLKGLDVSSTKRMFLNSVVEYGKDNLSKPATKFLYHNKQLPNRFSNAQDFWGYYNGAANGQFLPMLKKYYNVNENGLAESYPYPNSDANRSVNLEKSMNGILKEIVYPTGGSAKFTYEHNIGIKGEELRNIDLPIINPQNNRSEGLSFLEHELYNGDKYVGGVFTVRDVFGKVKFNVTLPYNYGSHPSSNQNISCANPILNDCRFNITLQGINGAPTYNYIFAGITELNVVPGEYRIILDPLDASWSAGPPANGELPTNDFIVTASWIESEGGNNLHAAGKRIKKIEYYNADNTLASFKEYAYKYPNGTPSGAILGLASFNAIRTINTQTNHGSTLNNITVLEPLGAIPGSPLTTYQGNTIGYSHVIEYYGSEDNNIGKNEYSFTNYKDGGVDLLYEDLDTHYTFPFHPPTDFEWLRGLPLKVSTFKKNGSAYSLIKKVTNQYMFAGEEYDYHESELGGGYPSIFAPKSVRRDIDEPMAETDKMYFRNNVKYRLPLIHMYVPLDETPNSWDNEHFEYKTYHFTGGVVDLLYSNETTYNEVGNISTVTKNIYDYDNHYQQKGTEITNSKGEVIKSINYYPVNKDELSNLETLESIAIDSLVSKNRFEVVQNEVYKDDVLQSKTRTNYKEWFDDLYLPKEVQTLKGVETPNNQLEARITYHAYDDNANPIEVSKVDGTRIVYIWGYHKTQPIAKIENATVTEVSMALRDIGNPEYNSTGKLQELSNLDNDRTLGFSGKEGKLREALNALRNSARLSKAQITSFTYDPLIGVTSITDPRGETMYYDYDEFSRLRYVKNRDGHIVKEHKYNYKN